MHAPLDPNAALFGANVTASTPGVGHSALGAVFWQKGFLRCARIHHVGLGLIPLMLLWMCVTDSRGQSYSIDWHTIDGGGGTSTGGVYSVTGTIGQPDASTAVMSGGPYSLTGGFWALQVVQTPGAPVLSIALTGSGQATLSWEPDGTGWILQESPTLSPANWADSPSGSANPAVVPATGPAKSYRLFKP